MLRKTHIAAGIGTALVVTHPETVSGIIAAVTGGALGGWIVDVDCKNADIDHEKFYDTLAEGLFIASLFVLDYLIEGGICHYILTHGLEVWISLFVFLFLTLLGYQTKHRTYTHSFLALGLFSSAVYFICRPMAIPFAIGYASHLLLDIFNKRGMQLFFPFKWKISLNKVYSDKRANEILMSVSFILDIIVVAVLLFFAVVRTGEESLFIQKVQSAKLFGLNLLQLYLLFINTISFIACQRDWNMYASYDTYGGYDEETRIQSDFHSLILVLYIFIGGGIGMLLFLISHLQYPSEYNSNWWACCYAGVMIWLTFYLYTCNPFGFTMKEIEWFTAKHIRLFAYLIGVNVVSALLFFLLRNKELDEHSFVHTLLFIVGAAGGTIGAYPVVIATHENNKYHYAVIGFPIMLAAQIIFILYMFYFGVS